MKKTGEWNNFFNLIIPQYPSEKFVAATTCSVFACNAGFDSSPPVHKKNPAKKAGF